MGANQERKRPKPEGISGVRLQNDSMVEARHRRFMQGKDFYEGVRCLLVDKKGSPDWEFKTVSDVSEAEVAKYFRPMSDASKELGI